jgi:hypothetical protein
VALNQLLISVADHAVLHVVEGQLGESCVRVKKEKVLKKIKNE